MKYAKLLDPREALRISLELVKPVGTERVPLELAYGRVLAEDIIADHDHPPFDRSTVDGFAVIAEDTYGAMEDRPVRLRYAFEVPVGARPSGPIGRGEAAYVATGAPLPPNANAVIPIEYAYREGERVTILRAAYPGMNVQPASSDVAKGEPLLRSGTRLDRAAISLVASQGLREVTVYRKPRALVISVGDELVEPGGPLKPGELYESNSFSIAALLRSIGLEVERKHVPDDLASIEAALGGDYDLYVTIGGTSKGPGDLTYKAVESLGKIVFHGLKIKPGKPTFLGLIRGKPVVGLPGFPGSCSFVAMFLLEPIARRLSGEDFERTYKRLGLSREVSNETGRYLRIPVRIYRGKAVPVPRGSGDVTLLSLADGAALIDPRAYRVREARVRLRGPRRRSCDVVTSHDPALMMALRDCLVIPAGSRKALEAVMLGEADFGGIHILTDRGYNIGLGVRVLRGYDREIGFVVAKGNPKRVESREDLTRVRFVNRNPGSGTRILIDRSLRERGIDPKDIEGYRVELKSHNAVAAAVKQGKADVGVAIRRAAEAYGLDFVPIGREEFDFAVFDESKLVRYADEIKRQASRLPGYRVPENFLQPKG